MIRIFETFDTEAEANAFRDRMYEAYHPAGYGTFIRVEYDGFEKQWVAHGTRAESCD